MTAPQDDGHSEVLVAQFGIRIEAPAPRWQAEPLTVLIELRLCGEDGQYEGRTMLNGGAWTAWEPVDLMLGAAPAPDAS